MRTGSPKGRVTWILCACVAAFVVPLTAYVVEYYRSVVPMYGCSSLRCRALPVYLSPVPIEDLDAFFEPIHRLDRWIRTEYWEPTLNK